MDKALKSLDWSMAQVFLAVADTGSLSGAARKLGLSQPTIGRQVQTMEAHLGVSLFRRQNKGMALTETGAALLESARAMQTAAAQFQVVAAGGDDGLNGTVRITASLFVAHHILPPVLADLRVLHPEISIDVIASDASENLLFREADIAVRMYRPQQLDVVTRHIGDVRLGLYGARRYLQRRGTPQSDQELMSHDFVGYDRNEEIILGFRKAGWDVDRDFFKMRCDNQTVYWELVRAGCGLGFSQVSTAEGDAAVQRVANEMKIPTLEVWLTAHEALRRTPRVARVWDVLADALEQACDLPPGAGVT